MKYTIKGKDFEALSPMEMTVNENAKREWVEEELAEFLISLRVEIVGTDYINIDHSLEFVRVHYEGGGYKDVHVSMDSRAAVVEDIYKQGAIY